MDDVRKGQIAFLFLRRQIREKGIRLTPSFRREVGNEAKAIGVSFEEAMEFAEGLVREVIEGMFPKKS